eukprot:scaffold52282_cov60-Phaeocystis_antarctica.AAC.4
MLRPAAARTSHQAHRRRARAPRAAPRAAHRASSRAARPPGHMHAWIYRVAASIHRATGSRAHWPDEYIGLQPSQASI